MIEYDRKTKAYALDQLGRNLQSFAHACVNEKTPQEIAEEKASFEARYKGLQYEAPVPISHREREIIAEMLAMIKKAGYTVSIQRPKLKVKKAVLKKTA